jgi:hypothetical protein
MSAEIRVTRGWPLAGKKGRAHTHLHPILVLEHEKDSSWLLVLVMFPNPAGHVVVGA